MVNIEFENENKEEGMDRLGYNEYYVAFLDILAFRNMVKDKMKDEILNIFNIICTDDKNSKSNFPVLYKKNCGMISAPTCEVNCCIMSDSMILYIKSNKSNSLSALIYRCKNIATKLLLKHILIRGGISKGGLYSNNNIIFGPGVVDAYMLQEKTAVVPRIVISGDIYKKVGESDLLFIESNKLMYIDEDKCRCVDYFDFNHTCKNEIVDFVNKNLDIENDLSIRNKYLYIFDKMCKR